MTSYLKHIKSSVLNSYSQIFFSTNTILSYTLLVVSFFDYTAGLSGLLAVLVSTVLTDTMGMEKATIQKGLYGFNNLLVGLGLGINFQLSIELMFIVVFASLLTTFITFACQGILGKYNLPYLSIPFLFGIWIGLLATSHFTALGLSARGVFSQNELVAMGGLNLLDLYSTLDNSLPLAVNTYFKSLGAIFFQYSVLAGLLISLGLLIYSRVVFSLSIIGYTAALIVYHILGIDVVSLSYSYIGFNYILAAIAIGGYFLHTSTYSFLATLFVLPILILLSYSSEIIMSNFALPVYSLPFNTVVLLFLYSLRFRTQRPKHLIEVAIHQDTPEENTYLQANYVNRMQAAGIMSISLPVLGEWTINQGYNGTHTHKGAWKHGLDFVIANNEKEYTGTGDLVTDYYCYGKNITAPADGYVVDLNDGIEDNIIGKTDLIHNWGNTIVIQHTLGLSTQMSHLLAGSINVKKGDYVQKGQVIAKVGNSGRSPYPHLHFQLQGAPHVGSPTLDYPLSNYLSQEDDTLRYHAHGTPKKGDSIQNVVSTPIVANAFTFTPGQELAFAIAHNSSEASPFDKLDDEYRFTVYSDIFKNTYLECNTTKAKAWFTTDGQIFHFSKYEGDKNSFLYYFMLSLFKIELGYSDNIVIKDRIPTHFIFSGIRLFLQDFTSPFFHFLNANYKLNYESIDDDMFPQEVKLKSNIYSSSFNRPLDSTDFFITITNKGVDHINIASQGNSLQAKRLNTAVS